MWWIGSEGTRVRGVPSPVRERGRGEGTEPMPSERRDFARALRNQATRVHALTRPLSRTGEGGARRARKRLESKATIPYTILRGD